jgi:hypothetical protein
MESSENEFHNIKYNYILYMYVLFLSPKGSGKELQGPVSSKV